MDGTFGCDDGNFLGEATRLRRMQMSGISHASYFGMSSTCEAVEGETGDTDRTCVSRDKRAGSQRAFLRCYINVYGPMPMSLFDTGVAS